MAHRSGREALRGAEVETLYLISQLLTSRQWSELLKGPLEHAAGQGNRGLAQKLVEAGAQIGDALHGAVRGGHGEVANDLLENGASIDAGSTARGFTPLHFAAGNGETDMLQLLMKRGADKDAMSNLELTPLFVATSRGQVAAAFALLTGGANVNLRCGQGKRSAVDVAAEEGHVDILRAVIEHGADVNAANTYQLTALHFAAELNEVEAIDVLVEAGADIEARTDGGATPLHVAANSPKLEAPTALLKHGAHANAQDNMLHTPWHYAATQAGTQGVAEVVARLLRSDADETIVDHEGNTAADVLAVGVLEGDRLAENVECVRKLLENAPADRAWRRRGYLVLCRAHPSRVLQIRDKSSSAHDGMSRRTRSSEARWLP